MTKEREFYTLANVSKKQMVQLFEISEEEAALVMKYRTKLPVLFDSVESEETHSVDMRELHSQLGVKDNFRNWIKRRTERLQVIDFNGADFSSPIESSTYDADILKQTNLTQFGQIDSIEYLAKPDIAKMICMQESNETGDLVRRYFLLCEKLLHRMATRNPIRESCVVLSSQILKGAASRGSKNPVKMKAYLEREVCNVATGAVPQAWRGVLGVRNVRDFLKHHGEAQELQRYEETLKMCNQLVNDKELTAKTLVEQLKRVFGTSTIYDRYIGILSAHGTIYKECV